MVRPRKLSSQSSVGSIDSGSVGRQDSEQQFTQAAPFSIVGQQQKHSSMNSSSNPPVKIGEQNALISSNIVLLFPACRG
jgi:hypothetical protein